MDGASVFDVPIGVPSSRYRNRLGSCFPVRSTFSRIVSPLSCGWCVKYVSKRKSCEWSRRRFFTCVCALRGAFVLVFEPPPQISGGSRQSSESSGRETNFFLEEAAFLCASACERDVTGDLTLTAAPAEGNAQ